MLHGELPQLTVPETLHALVAARLDALSPEDRAVASTASVLGLSFTFPALQAVTELPETELETALERLIRHQLLLMDRSALPERGQYKFVQGVIREVAYGTLGRRDRRARHLAAARYFESLDDDELAGVLASHYLDAYRASSDGSEADALAAQARVTLRAAADRAASLHAQTARSATWSRRWRSPPRGSIGHPCTSAPRGPLDGRAGRRRPSSTLGGPRSSTWRSPIRRACCGRARLADGSLLGEHQDQAAATLLREALDEGLRAGRDRRTWPARKRSWRAG